MKPGEEQKKYLKDCLGEWLQFRETYLEVYDHILTALEERGTKDDFETAVNNIVQQDFGGWQQLQEMEQTAFETVSETSRIKYKSYLLKQIAGLELAVTILVATGVYLLINAWPQAAVPMGFTCLLCYFLPRIINWYRHFRQGYIFKNSMRSIRDAVFYKVASNSIRLYWLILLPAGLWFRVTISPLGNKIVFTLFFMLGWVYLRAFLKMYRDEIKMSVFA